MWNFFKRLFGGGSKQTQIAKAKCVAIQTGDSIKIFDIGTTNQHSLERLNIDRQRELSEKMRRARNPHSMEPADVSPQVDRFEKTRRNVDTIRANMLRKEKASPAPYRIPYMTPLHRATDSAIERQNQERERQASVLRDNEERRRKQQYEANNDVLTQTQIWSNISNTTTNHYTPPETTRHECAPTHHSHHNYDSGHSHSCSVLDTTNNVDNSSISISNMD